jgi:hypothetical protein
MPRLIPDKHCPHCRIRLPEPKPRACPDCGGSLHQRFLRAGCLSSAPGLLLAGWAGWELWRALGGLGG